MRRELEKKQLFNFPSDSKLPLMKVDLKDSEGPNFIAEPSYLLSASTSNTTSTTTMSCRVMFSKENQ